MPDGDENRRRGPRIGNERLCRVSAAAIDKFKEVLAQHNRSDGALRIAVVGGGMSGLKYKVDLVDGPSQRDVLVIAQNTQIVIDPKSARFITGSILDVNAVTGDFEVRAGP
jgi:iron-sulfur cluster assembly accessory protein